MEVVVGADRFRFGGPPIKMMKDEWCERCQDWKPERGFKGWCYDCRKEMIVSYLMYRALRWFAKPQNYTDWGYTKAHERAAKAILHYGK